MRRQREGFVFSKQVENETIVHIRMVNSVGDYERTFKCKWPYIYGKRDSIELPNEATKSEKNKTEKTNKRASLKWLVTNLDNTVILCIMIRIKLYTAADLFVCNTWRSLSKNFQVKFLRKNVLFVKVSFAIFQILSISFPGTHQDFLQIQKCWSYFFQTLPCYKGLGNPVKMLLCGES